MKIYTKRGDTGLTDLFNGERVAKTHDRIVAVGVLDEVLSDFEALVGWYDYYGVLFWVVAAVGLMTIDPKSIMFTGPLFVLFARNAASRQAQFALQMRNLMVVIHQIQASVATPASDKYNLHEGVISDMEQAIDNMTERLPELKNFILHFSSPRAILANRVRTTVRRAEREILKLSLAGGEIDPVAIKFINRLSDYMFIVARSFEHAAGNVEAIVSFDDYFTVGKKEDIEDSDDEESGSEEESGEEEIQYEIQQVVSDSAAEAIEEDTVNQN